MIDDFCPQCGAKRIGEFRSCRSCGLDFDELTRTVETDALDAPTVVTAVPGVSRAVPAGTSPPTRRARPFVRYAAVAVAALIGLGLIDNFAGAGLPAANIGESIPTPTATPAEPSGVAPTAAPATQPATALAPTGATIKGRVTKVIDGDTIVVAIAGKSFHVRYIGMDTPEDVKPNTPVQFMAREAAAANAKLVAGKTVILEKDVSETDRFGRLLRNVWVDRGGQLILVGLELVRTGFAQVTTFPPDVKYVDELLAAQDTAQAAGLGLWSEPTASAATRPTTKPKPTTKPQGIVGGSNCHPSYSPCLPIVDDLDCKDVRAMGKAPVRVKGPDDYRLDGDHDGIGCE